MAEYNGQSITVDCAVYTAHVVKVGTDKNGRDLWRCPTCGDETAWFDSDGRFHCPTHEGLVTVLTQNDLIEADRG